ncbi:MAG: MBL fold metallo-hydrolase [Chthoniobacterales bacterium]|nr:MBL fold metallo-hydrolase [Chthoniobacterales bacterium]
MVNVLDTRQLDRAGIIAVTALETDEGIVLFDTGPESTFRNVAAELTRIGAHPEDVRHVFLSHIHFDHAGAAWCFAELGAAIYVHPDGARHLLDPAKIVDSAARIFGDEMERLWGRIAPVSERNVIVLEDLDVVCVPPFEFRALATTGHANHHHVYHWDDTIFAGDIAGVRLGGGPPIPPFVPPELHIESWRESLERIRALNAAKLYLPHFGLVEGSVSAHLDAVEERVCRWSIWFRNRIREGENEAQLMPAFAEYEACDLSAGGATEEDVADYEAADPSYMAVTAAMRYWRKYHPEEVTP